MSVPVCVFVSVSMSVSLSVWSVCVCLCVCEYVYVSFIIVHLLMWGRLSLWTQGFCYFRQAGSQEPSKFQSPLLSTHSWTWGLSVCVWKVQLLIRITRSEFQSSWLLSTTIRARWWRLFISWINWIPDILGIFKFMWKLKHNCPLQSIARYAKMNPINRKIPNGKRWRND